MTRNGKIYELKTWVLRTEGSASGLLHTPNTHLDMQERMKNIAWNGKNKHSATLPKMVQKWPTPHANASTGPGRQGRSGGPNLQTAVNVETIDEYYERTGEMMGSLNPTWVDALMGYMPGWTDGKREYHVSLLASRTE